MPTVVTRYVNTASSGGNGTTNGTSGATAAYASLEAARADIISDYPDLVSADVQIDLICSGATDDTTAVTNTWPTSDATRYIHIQVPAADRKVPWDSNVYTYGRSASFAAALAITTNTIRLSGVQLYHAGSLDVGGNDGLALACSGSGGTIVCDGVKAWKSANAGQAAFRINNAAGTYVFRNCIAGGSTFRFRAGVAMTAGPSDTTVLAFNNTVQLAGTSTGLSIVFTAGGSNKIARLKNNLIQSATTGITVTNATTDDQVTNYASTTTDATFVNATAGDFTLQASDTKAIDLGTDLSGEASWPFTQDADLHNRTGTWDLGAHEYGATASTVANTAAGVLTLTGFAPSVSGAQLRVTQAGLKVLVTDAVSTAALRATQMGVKALLADTPDLRVTQAGVKALAADDADLRVTQAGIKALAVDDPDLRVTQAGVKVLIAPSALSVPLTGLLFPRGSVPPF